MAIIQNKDDASISLKIQPGAKKSEIVEINDSFVKIKIKAPPVDGKANSELIRFLSKLLNVSKSSIKIIRGEFGREKTVLVRNCESIISKISGQISDRRDNRE